MRAGCLCVAICVSNAQRRRGGSFPVPWERQLEGAPGGGPPLLSTPRLAVPWDTPPLALALPLGSSR